MPVMENAPSPKAESVICYLGGSNDVPSTGIRPAQFPAPVVSRHWFRDSDLLEVLQ